MVLFVILNIVSFFDLLFILLIVYYGFKFFLRYFGPRVVEKAADKIYRDLKAQEDARRRPETSSPGKITVERTDRKEKIFRKNDGEYVDFEEVK
ncbi:MAG: DUF4834 family protein [Bacteroidetes bacterium]|nr:DUF4834 family protein [Bacteroidota bacterium]MCL6101320.1 DUF4834 family protein [Bacteroidota bacterium]